MENSEEDQEKGIKKICPICKKEFFVLHRIIRRKRGKFCSIKCFYKNKKLNLSGEKSSQWKGENAGYAAKHIWIANELGRPKICWECGVKTLSKRQYHWANISGKYKRDVNDYKRLCVKCHSFFDSYSRPRGEKAISSKLTEKDILKIRKLYIFGKHGYGSVILARKFNVHFSAILRIIKRETWKHI